MAERRLCAERNARGEPCGAWAMHEGACCFRHAPEHAEAAAEASRLGGLRRRKEATVQQVYDFAGFESPEDITRLLHIAAVEALALENSVPRARALAYIAAEARRTLEVGELAERLAALERSVGMRRAPRKGR